MEIKTFGLTIIIYEVILLVIIIVSAIVTKFRKPTVTLQFLILMVLGLIVTCSSLTVTITGYEGGYDYGVINSAEMDKELNTFTLASKDKEPITTKFYIYGTETKLYENAKIELKTSLGVKIYITDNIAILAPSAIADENMSVSRQKAYIEELNNRRISLW